MAHVMTVTGPIPVGELGPTDAHDHLFIDTPAQPGETLAELDRAVAELEEGRASGLRSVVELTPIGMGRLPKLLAESSRRTGVAIVAATGFHHDAHYRPGDWALDATEEELAERVVAELRDGIEDGIRPGVIKGAASLNGFTPAEERRLRAIAAAAIETGAAVIVHTEAGTAARDVVALLLGAELPPERLTLAHLDRNPDREQHLYACHAGVNLVYDTIGRQKYGPDSARIDLIADVVEAGYPDRLMLGLDLGRPAYHRAYGGTPGMRHLMTEFVPLLRQRVADAAVDAMLIANPARILAMPGEGATS